MLHDCGIVMNIAGGSEAGPVSEVERSNKSVGSFVSEECRILSDGF